MGPSRNTSRDGLFFDRISDALCAGRAVSAQPYTGERVVTLAATAVNAILDL